MNSSPTSLNEKAYQLVEEMIVTLALEPGAIFSENELSQSISIGRTPLREALQRLAHEGLVRVMPRRGMMVTEINATEHLSLLETRRVIDRLIAQRAAERATPLQRDQLRTLASSMHEAAEDQDVNEFMRIDKACDITLGLASRNTSAARAAAPLHALCRRFWFAYQNMGDLKKSAVDHHKLMIAVAEGDASAAHAASDHLLDYLELFTREALHLVS